MTKKSVNEKLDQEILCRILIEKEFEIVRIQDENSTLKMQVEEFTKLIERKDRQIERRDKEIERKDKEFLKLLNSKVKLQMEEHSKEIEQECECKDKEFSKFPNPKSSRISMNEFFDSDTDSDCEM